MVIVTRFWCLASYAPIVLANRRELRDDVVGVLSVVVRDREVSLVRQHAGSALAAAVTTGILRAWSASVMSTPLGQGAKGAAKALALRWR